MPTDQWFEYKSPTNGLDARVQGIHRLLLRKTAATSNGGHLENGSEKLNFGNYSESLIS